MCPVRRLNGKIPSALVAISPKLDTALINANKFSCEIPKEFKTWQSPPGANVSILLGNQFACPVPTTRSCASLSEWFQCPRGDTLAAIDDSAAAYACGNSAYVMPLIVMLASFAVFLLALVVLHSKRPDTFSNVRDLWTSTRISVEYNVMNHLIVGSGLLFGLCVIAMGALLYYQFWAQSDYHCQYLARPSLGLKSLTAGLDYVAAMSCALAAGGIFVWCRHCVTNEHAWHALFETGEPTATIPPAFEGLTTDHTLQRTSLNTGVALGETSGVRDGHSASNASQHDDRRSRLSTDSARPEEFSFQDDDRPEEFHFQDDGQRWSVVVVVFV